MSGTFQKSTYPVVFIMALFNVYVSSPLCSPYKVDMHTVTSCQSCLQNSIRCEISPDQNVFSQAFTSL